MKFSRVLIVIAVLFSFSEGFGQENVFLDRSYWKTNPSVEKIEKDIASGNDITALTGSMFDAVCYALMEKTDNATIKYLLSKKGNEVDKHTHDGRTYIFWAAYKDNLEIMNYLVEKGAKANIEDSHGYSVLNFAAVTGQTNTKLYDFLLQHGADIKANNHDGANALLLVAPFAKSYTLLEYFINKGISLDSEDTNGNGIFHYAAKGGHIPLLKTLASKNIPVNTLNKKKGNAMLLASQGTRRTQNSLKTYQYLEELGIEVNTTDAEGHNPLHAIAYRNEDSAIFNYFIEKGVDVNQQDNKGRSPFMNAAYRNTVEAVRFLISNVESIDDQDKEGKTALSLAVARNSPEMVAFLLQEGADVHIKDKKGNTMAYYLVNSFSKKNEEVFDAKMSLLSKKGLSLEAEQSNGNTLLHLAAKENNLALLKKLNKLGIDINKKNSDGNTALHLAAMSSNNDTLLRYLVEKGADTSLKTDFEESAYDLVAENEKLKDQLSNLNFLK